MQNKHRSAHQIFSPLVGAAEDVSVDLVGPCDIHLTVRFLNLHCSVAVSSRQARAFLDSFRDMHAHILQTLTD